MNTLQRSLLLVTVTATFFLAACGGGGDTATTSTTTTGTPTTQTPPSTPSGVDFAAVGSSASTVSLGWTRPAGSATYAIERKSAGGDWVAVASVEARSGTYLDSGLAALTDYSYRLVEVGANPTTLAQSAAKTSDEQPVITAAGSALAQAVTTKVGSAGGALASPDGAIVVDVPAGAFTADTQATTQAVTNTAPDGRGDGLKIRIDAAPSAALTLTLRYEAAQDAEADAQRIAVQRADGGWLSLPVLALDKTARTLTAELPPSFFAAPAATARVATAGARSTGTVRPAALVDVSLSFTVVRYLAFYLKPQQALMKVKTSLDLAPYARVRGYEIEIGLCARSDPSEACVMQPVMETREVVFLNSKAGFERGWYVFAEQGGNSTFGTVTPAASVGAKFKAPNRVPDPSTVIVSFHSRHIASGRVVTLSSPIEIWDDRWFGTMSAENGPSDAGTTFTAVADVTWETDAAASSDTRKVYRASGFVGVEVKDDDCIVTIAPAAQLVSTDARLVELVVDESNLTYTARLITFWTATLSAVCPKGSATDQTLGAGYGWEVKGSVSADGRRIEGSATDESGAKIAWTFTR